VSGVQDAGLVGAELLLADYLLRLELGELGDPVGSGRRGGSLLLRLHLALYIVPLYPVGDRGSGSQDHRGTGDGAQQTGVSEALRYDWLKLPLDAGHLDTWTLGRKVPEE